MSANSDKVWNHNWYCLIIPTSTLPLLRCIPSVWRYMVAWYISTVPCPAIQWRDSYFTSFQRSGTQMCTILLLHSLYCWSCTVGIPYQPSYGMCSSPPSGTSSWVSDALWTITNILNSITLLDLARPWQIVLKYQAIMLCSYASYY